MADMYMEYARLLTNEDIVLNYSDEADTAYFDMETRSIIIPMFEYLDKICTASLTAHECGHALYSNYDVDEVIDIKDVYGDIFNVIEDGYIEKKISSQYPGITYFFKKAYSSFYENDFFKVDKEKLDELNFLEKLNLNLKLNRIGINIPMDNAVENKFLHKAYIVNSNDEVIQLCDEIYEYMKSHSMEQTLSGNMEIFEGGTGRGSGYVSVKMVEDEGDGTSESSENDVDTTSSTMNSFKESLKEAIEKGKEEKKSENFKEGTKKYPIIIEDGLIRKDLMDDISKYIPKLDIYFESNADEFIENKAKLARKLARNAVVYFEKLKQAKAIKNEKNKQTGKIDPRKLAHYKTSNNIFTKRRIQPNQQNHGIVILVDYSSSMRGIIQSVLLQTAIVAEFCKSEGIPFSIIAYGASYFNDYSRNEFEKKRQNIVDKDIYLCSNFNNKTIIKIADDKNYSLKGLLSFYPSFFGDVNFIKKFSRLFFKNFYLQMGQTPTDNAVLCAYEELKEMKSAYGLDKTSLIVITDGDHNNLTPYTNIVYNYYHDKSLPSGLVNSIEHRNIEFDYNNIIFNNYHINANEVMKSTNTADYGNYGSFLESLFYMIKKDLNSTIVFSYIENGNISRLAKSFKYFNDNRNRNRNSGYNDQFFNGVYEYILRVFDDYYKINGTIPQIADTEKVKELRNLSVIDRVILSDCKDINKMYLSQNQELIDSASTMSKLKNAIKKISQNFDFMNLYVKYLIEEIS